MTVKTVAAGVVMWLLIFWSVPPLIGNAPAHPRLELLEPLMGSACAPVGLCRQYA